MGDDLRVQKSYRGWLPNVNMKDSYATFSVGPVPLFLYSTPTVTMGSIDPIPSDLLSLDGTTNPQGIRERLPDLFDQNITAKILRTAVKHLEENASSLLQCVIIAYSLEPSNKIPRGRAPRRFRLWPLPIAGHRLLDLRLFPWLHLFPFGAFRQVS